MKRMIVAGWGVMAILSGLACFGQEVSGKTEVSTNRPMDPKAIQFRMEQLLGERREVRGRLLAVEEQLSVVLRNIQAERQQVLAKDAELQVLQKEIAAKQAEFERKLAAKSGKSAEIEKKKTELLKQHSELTRRESDLVVELSELRSLKK